MVQETSSGGIVVFRGLDAPLFLLLQHEGGKHWDVPKGHVEKGETLEETALREIMEESGIPKESLTVLAKLKHVNRYSFFHNRSRIEKEVHLFLVESSTDQVTLSNEHINYGWFEECDINAQLTFDTSLPAFREVYELLKVP